MKKQLRRHVTEYYKDTGEVIAENDYPVNNEDLILISRNKMFAKRFITKEPQFSNRAYLGNWYILTAYLEQNTNILVERKRDSNYWLHSVRISPKRMQTILGISATTHYRFVKECAEKGYMAEIRNNVNKEISYIMSPIYVLNGVGISAELFLHFKGVKEIEDALTLSDKAKIRRYLGDDADKEEQVNDNAC